MSQAQQVAYDTGMTKASESLIAQLRDVARAFYIEVWGQALSATRVSEDSELRAPDRIYYPPALRLASTLSQPPTDTNVAPPSSSDQPASTPSVCPSKVKEQEQPPPDDVVEVEAQEVTQVTQQKKKKEDKEQEKQGGKGKHTFAQHHTSLRKEKPFFVMKSKCIRCPFHCT